MTKPPSIARFEQFYWGSIVLGWIATAIDWRSRQAQIESNPILANAHWFLPMTLLINVLIAVALWFFIARKSSVVAKWIQVVFAALNVIGVLSIIFQLATGRAPSVVTAVLAIAGCVLYVAAATMLFKPDAKEWFGEGLDEEDPESLA